MSQLFANAARSALQASILAGDTSITVAAADADLYPVATTGVSAVPTAGLDYFKVVLENTAHEKEIVYVRTRALGAATFTNCLRGQEGTTARSYLAGSVVGLRHTAIDLAAAIDLATTATAAGKAVVNAADAAAQRSVLSVPSKAEIQGQTHTGFTTTGSSTTYAIATLPVQPTLVAGQRYRIKLHTPNGLNPTLARDTLASAPFKIYDATGAKVAPAAGALPPLFDAEYDGVDFVVLNPLPNTGRVQQNGQSVDYTLVLADEGKHLFHPTSDATARAWTIPANASVAFEVGAAITFVNQNGAGSISIAITTDTMRLAGPGTVGTRTLAANGMATALKVAATEWIISGVGLT